MPEPLKLGFIGGGPRAESLWMAIFFNEQNEDKVIPEAVFDINGDVLKYWKYRVNNLYNDPEKFLNSDIDAVIIATPPSTHAELSVRCLEAGLNVWCEVPMALTLEEVYAVLDADRANIGGKGRYTFGENYCYYPEVQFIAEKYGKDEIGDAYYAEGEYLHSVEHYMIKENYIYNKKLDPEIYRDTEPTWRAGFIPIKYGHSLGPVLYVLNKRERSRIEYPVSVYCVGNMKMLKRFGAPNFQVATVKTNRDTIIKFSTAFVLGHPGRIYCLFYATRGMYISGSRPDNRRYYYSVPPEKGNYPDRHEGKTILLSDEELKKEIGYNYTGSHHGADMLMFSTVIDAWLKNEPGELDAVSAAEISAAMILAAESSEKGKVLEVPEFR